MEFDLNKQAARDFAQRADKLRMAGLGHIVTSSAGALALLVTFRGTLLSGSPSALWALRASWIGLAVAVVTVVLGNLLAAEFCDTLVGEPNELKKVRLYARLADLMTVASAIAFCVGVLGLALFGLANL